MAKQCPSDAYAAELVTASGLTIAHPLEDPGTTAGVPHSIIDWSGSEVDYAEWDALTAARIGDLEHAWRLLKDWPKTASMPAATYDGFVERLNAIRERYANMRKPWRSPASSADTDYAWGLSLPELAFDATDEIAQIAQLALDTQCLRENINDALAAMGGTPVLPGAGHTPAGEGLGLLGTALLVSASVLIVGGAIWGATKIAKKGRTAA